MTKHEHNGHRQTDISEKVKHGAHSEPHEHCEHKIQTDTLDKNEIEVKAAKWVLTVRAVAGLSGDMMLSGLAGLAELTNDDLDMLVKELKLPALTGSVKIAPHAVNHINGVKCHIDLPSEHSHRTFNDIRTIISDSLMPIEAKELSIQAFALLAQSEADVHGKKVDEVHFHEVGALDSILDTCLSCRIFTLLNPSLFVCSPLPLADGVIRCAHGYIPSPAPAVLRLLKEVPVQGFSGRGETVTPTAISLLKALGATFGQWPSMTVDKTLISYGGKVFANAPNGAIWALGNQ